MRFFGILQASVSLPPSLSLSLSLSLILRLSFSWSLSHSLSLSLSWKLPFYMSLPISRFSHAHLCGRVHLSGQQAVSAILFLAAFGASARAEETSPIGKVREQPSAS